MDRRDEKRWREKVSVGTVKIAKSAWVWDDGRSFGQRTVYGKERPRDHEQSRGEDKYWGKDRVIYEREHGEERAKREDQGEGRPPGEDRSRGEGRSSGEEQSRGEERPRRAERSQDQERFPKDKEQVQEKAGAEWQEGVEEKLPGQEKERGQEQEGKDAQDSGKGRSQDLGRGLERKKSKEPTSHQAQGRGLERKRTEETTCHQAQGRGLERKRTEEPTSHQAQGRGLERKRTEETSCHQAQGRGLERKRSEETTCHQAQGRGLERKRTEEPTSHQAQGRGLERKRSEEPTSHQAQGRGLERKRTEEPTSFQTQRLSQGRGHSLDGGVIKDSQKDKTKTRSRFLSSTRAKRKGRDEEQCEGGAACEGGAKSRNKSLGRKAREKKGSGRARNKKRVLAKSRVRVLRADTEKSKGSSCMVCCPAMSPVSPVWPRKPKLWAFCVLLLVLLLSWKSWAVDHFQHCHWLVVLNDFEKVGSLPTKTRFVDQEPIDTVTEMFQNLVDLPIDPQEKYMSFPYYLKISFSCTEQDDQELVRKSHLMGMRPVIVISYMYSVNFYRWEMENLQIQMEAAPLRTSGFCSAEVMCTLNWYAPMPIKNGSVVMSVDINSNGLGVFIRPKRFYININGFLKKDASGKAIFTVGYESSMMKSTLFSRSKSRPLWYTIGHAPVLILGGIENEKVILLSDTNFQDYSLIELSIDSCWVGSYYCPMLQFSATIHDAISTESTLFIRQNQLVYYFTGRYSTLFEDSHSSSEKTGLGMGELGKV